MFFLTSKPQKGAIEKTAHNAGRIGGVCRLFTRPVNRSRSGGLDALRLVLALWVVFAHLFPWYAYVNGSNPGLLGQSMFLLERLFQRHGETHPAVLAFIVLSGYCIHRNGFRNLSYFSLRAYAVRRAFRILPVYFLGALAGLIAWDSLSPAFYAQVAELTGTPDVTVGCILVKSAGIAAFFPNLHVCSFQGNAPLTTAQVEIWLYVFYGLVVWAASRKPQCMKILVWVATGYWAVMFSYVVLNEETLGWWHNGSFISFLVFWWVGAFFAEFDLGVILGSNKKKLWVAFLAALVVMLPFAGDSLVLVELKKLAFTVLSGCFIRWVDSCIRNAGILGTGGELGYDIYALHAPLLVVLLLCGASITECLVVVLAVSALCHLYYEKPLIRFGKKLAG